MGRLRSVATGWLDLGEHVLRRCLILLVLTSAVVTGTITPAVADDRDPLWVATLDTPDDDRPRDVAVDPATGQITAAGSVSGPGARDLLVAAFDSEGARLWARQFGRSATSVDTALDLALDTGSGSSAGNAYVVGSSTANGGATYVVVAYDRQGRRVWSVDAGRALSPTRATAAVVVDPGSGTVVVAATVVDGDGEDYVTSAYTADGQLRWRRVYDGGSGNDVVAAAALESTYGQVVVTGTSAGPGRSDYATVAYSLDGRPLWTARYDGVGEVEDEASALATADGIVYVGGYSRTSPSEWVVVAYDRRGREQWTAGTPPLEGDFIEQGPTALVVDSTVGAVHLTGRTTDGGLGSGNMETLSYTLDGALRWQVGYDVPGTDSGQTPAGLAVDPATGRIYVSVTSIGAGLLVYDQSGQPVYSDRYRPGASTAAGLALDISRGRVFNLASLTGLTPDGASALAVLAYPL